MNTLIVGASSGIGKECAHVFSAQGHNTICSARDKDELDYLVSDLKIRYGSNSYAIPLDLSQLSTLNDFVNKAYTVFDKIDCVVVTSATMPPDGAEYSDSQALLDTTMTNYLGVAALLNKLTERMMKTESGVIICLSSVAGDRGRKSNFIYGATKSALNTYLQGLRMKLHSYNIRVVTVMPGYVDTLMAYGKVQARFAVSPSYFAERVYALVQENRNIVYIPGVWWFIAMALKSIPESVYKRLPL